MNEGAIVSIIQGIFTASHFGELAAIALARVWIFLYIPFLSWLWVYGSKKERHSAEEALWAGGVAVLFAELVSLVVLRIRPYLAVSDVISLVPPPLTSSFPSSHTTIAIAITTALYFANRRAGHAALLIAFGVMLGRLAAGVHYPSDILGGIVIGLLSFALIRMGHHAVRHLT